MLVMSIGLSCKCVVWGCHILESSNGSEGLDSSEGMLPKSNIRPCGAFIYVVNYVTSVCIE